VFIYTLRGINLLDSSVVLRPIVTFIIFPTKPGSWAFS